MLAAAPGRAAPSARLIVAYHDQQDELWRLSSSGETLGIAPQILEDVVGRRAGYALDYAALPWLRAQEAVRNGEADALFTIPNADRRGYALFTPSPLVRYPFALVYPNDGPNTAALDQADTIQALTRFNYVYNQFDMAQTARAARFSLNVASPGDGPMLREVAGGRGDFTIVNAIRIHRALEAAGLADRLKVRTVPALGQIEHYFGLRQSYPDAAGIIARIETATHAAVAEGSIQAIIASHV